MRQMAPAIAGFEAYRSEIIGELARAKGSQQPQSLYHYTGTNGVAGILHSNHLWATHYGSLNDASELVYGARLLVDELRLFASKSDPSTAELMRRLATFYTDHGASYRSFFETFVISFTEDADILSQWRAYADEARGCCIEFSLADSRLFTVLGSTPWALEMLPVIYEEPTQRALVRSGLSRMVRYLDATETPVKKLLESSDMQQWVSLGLLMHAFEPFHTAFKHRGFAEEREWRAVASCAGVLASESRKKRADGKAYYIECLFIQGDAEKLWQRPLLPIPNIRFGPLSDEPRREVVRQAAESCGYKQIVYSVSDIPVRR